MPVNDLFVTLVACAFALMGAGALWRPWLVTRQFGVDSLSRAGNSETRAVYGGFGILMAVMLLSSLSHPEIRAGVCLTIAAALGGMGLGRIVSLLADKGIDRVPAVYLMIEVVAAIGLILAA